MFKIGEKVVCVDNFNNTDDMEFGVIYPVKNNTYTIREIVIDGDVFFRLEEIQNHLLPYIDGDGECYFISTKFRKLADISETTYNEVMEWIESGKPIEILN